MVNPEELKRNAVSKRAENDVFRNLVRLTKASELDLIAQPLIQLAYKEIDCTTCGNCCRQLRPPVTPDDVNRLITDTHYTEETFTAVFLQNTGHEKYQIMACQPCTFLKGDICGVYIKRPLACADYPHLHHKNLKYRIRSVLENYSVCPIVVQVIDQLKDLLMKKE